MDLRAAAVAAAQRNGVDPNLFLRLIKQESGFNPQAVSRAGALGPAQLMPDTAAGLGVDPRDPIQNLEGGARYLRQQLDAFKDPVLALAAYNAGPGAVRKYGGVPPYAETQKYVRNIMGAAAASMGGGGGRIASSSGGTPAMGLMDFQQSPEPQTFKERLKEGVKSGALWDNLALAFNSMRLNPDQGIGQIVQSRQEQRAQERTANRTAQWLMSQGREDLARALLSGAVDAKTAAAVALTPPADNRTALMQNYEYAISQGMTPAEARQWVSSGSVTNVNLPNESQGALNKKLAESEAATLGAYLTQGNKAASMTQDLALLDEVLKYAPQNPLAGRVAEMFPGVSSAGAAAQSIIKRVAPSLRVEGSGSTSDIEYAGMLQSLPSLVNYPEANAAILEMMKAKAAIDLERGQIVRTFQNSSQTPADAAAMRQRLSELDQRSIMTPELGRAISGLSGAPAPTEKVAAPQPTGSAPPVGTVKQGYRFKGGDPADPANWEQVR